MKGTEIITLNPITAAARTFKDERLAKATQRITAIYTDAAKYADTKNREIAKILGDVAEKEAYKEDGFKSVADYASTVFGIARQNAYALSNAGKVYNDPKAHPELKAMSPSKLAELAPLDDKTVKEALDAGTITHDTTQKALREFADKAKNQGKSDKPEVLDTFTVRPCILFVDEKDADTYTMNKTMEEWDEFFFTMVAESSPETPVEIIKLPKGKVDFKADKATVTRRLYLNRGYSIAVEFFKYTPVKAPKAPKPPKKPNFTREELLAMLADMDATDTSDSTAQK